MPLALASVASVQTGRVAPLGARGVPSGFIKRAVAGAIRAERLGLAGDEQADLSVHGGPDKAIYCYPREHYARWRGMTPGHIPLLMPGSFGENLTTLGLDEDGVAIGDVFRIGTALVQVSQPRLPCFKLALRFNDPQMVRMIVRSGLSGWYLRVLEEGSLEIGAPITRLDRTNPAWSITRCYRLMTTGSATREEVGELAELPGLAPAWQETFREALTLPRSTDDELRS